MSEQILASKILERRKAQGLTQEQLGNAIGVSPQAVSKWELGESLPDISILPSLCRILEVSADTLLGIDGGIGIETLSRELTSRIHAQPSATEALMTALKFLHLGANGPTWNPNLNIAFDFKDNQLRGMDLWDKEGLAIFVKEAILDAEDSSEEMIEGIRILVSPTNWKIALYLLKGAAKIKTLLNAGLVESIEILQEHLTEMIDAGLVTQDRDGYKLDDQWGMIWTTTIKGLTYKLHKGGQLFNWRP